MQFETGATSVASNFGAKVIKREKGSLPAQKLDESSDVQRGRGGGERSEGPGIQGRGASKE